MKNKKIAIIGCGNLGESILEGLLNISGYAAKNIIATKRNLKTLDRFKGTGVMLTSDNAEAIKKSEIIIVTLGRQHMLAILAELRNHLDPKKHILISLTTGISLQQLATATAQEIPLFRAVPNVAAGVKQSITCISSDVPHTHDTFTSVEQLFNSLGETLIIKEDLIESATILGACGIAYVLRFMRAMVQGGIQIGFDVKTANLIVNQVVIGASSLLMERGEHPESEIDKVTTPRGCTIAGLNDMEHNGFSSALIKGIVTSFSRLDT